MKDIFRIFPFLLVLTSCLKKAPEPNEYNNFFDLNHDTGVWFEESVPDSFHWGGGTYHYQIYFNIVSEELQKFDLSEYRLMMKRPWQSEFVYIFGNTSTNFNITSYPADKVDGHISIDFGVKSEYTDDIVRIHKYTATW